MELLALAVLILVLVGSSEMVVLMVVEDPFGVTELMMNTVDPSLWVSVTAFGVDVESKVKVVVPWIVTVDGALVVTPNSVTVALMTLFLVAAPGVIVSPSSWVTT
jgi:hypothetical protein